MVNQGDIIWLDFDPQTGHEQRGRRPALVCPITHTDKNHPFHIRLNKTTNTTGVILCDQVRTLDINARNYAYIEKIDDETLFEVIDIISGFIEIEKTMPS